MKKTETDYRKPVYRIGDIARISGITARTIRYYEELGLLREPVRKDSSQRLYSREDLIHIKRILQLKSYGLTLSEIKEIITRSREDPSGQKSRLRLLMDYRKKLREAEEKKRKIEEYMKELQWHIEQLENVENFNACPGEECARCEYAGFCEFVNGNELKGDSK